MLNQQRVTELSIREKAKCKFQKLLHGTTSTTTRNAMKSYINWNEMKSNQEEEKEMREKTTKVHPIQFIRVFTYIDISA